MSGADAEDFDDRRLVRALRFKKFAQLRETWGCRTADNTYNVTLNASGEAAATVAVTVTNEDETGTVTLDRPAAAELESP